LKILVTGGAGFIASNITDALINEGHDVVILDNLSTGRKENINPKAKFVLGDITEDLTKLFDEEKFDVVNHHAAQMDVRKSVADPTFDATVNILGTINLLQNCIRTGVKKFMFASTGGAVYGEQDYFPADEKHPTFPLSPYGISKMSVEKYIYFYSKQYNLKYSILRYANIYGPRQNPFGEAGVVAIFTTKFLNKEQPVINGPGTQTRDYVFVGDVVKANLTVLNDTDDTIYNVGTGIETDVNQIFNILNEATGAGMEEKHGPALPGEQLRSVITSDKLFNKFGFRPSITMKEGLEKTLNYYKNLVKK
jgi:UDP-glucose 4-epimerase